MGLYPRTAYDFRLICMGNESENTNLNSLLFGCDVVGLVKPLLILPGRFFHDYFWRFHSLDVIKCASLQKFKCL